MGRLLPGKVCAGSFSFDASHFDVIHFQKKRNSKGEKEMRGGENVTWSLATKNILAANTLNSKNF